MLLDASEIAGMLGTSRQYVTGLAFAGAGFPPPIAGDDGSRRRWNRGAIERWAAGQQGLACGWRRPQLSAPGSFTPHTHRVFDIAAGEATAFNHDFIGDVHVLLALLHPDCPGMARTTLESCGMRLDEIRRWVVDAVGRPATPPRGGQLLDRETNGLLERAKLKAIDLRDEDISSEHILLGLCDVAQTSQAGRLLARSGLKPAELAERVIVLTERAGAATRPPPGDTVAQQHVNAAGAARVLGVSRRRVVELAASPGFPGSEVGPAGHRRWPRRAIIQWAADHPDRGPPREPRSPAAARYARRLDEIFALALAQAQQLNHSWVGPQHLLLAMLHDDCPGLGRDVLQSLGVSLEQTRQAWIDSMGDPFEPRDRPQVGPPQTHHLLDRGELHATELEDDEIASEHVLLALTDDWSGLQLATLIAQPDIDATRLRDRLISMTDGMLPAPKSPAPRNWPEPSPRQIARPPEPALARSPLGHDPRRRRPWGSGVFATEDGETFTQGIALRQYRLDRDGYPILTTDGQPIHSLIDDEGRNILDEDGNHIDTVVDVPPGARMQAYADD